MGKKKSKAPSISGEGFKGTAEISLADLKKITVEAFNKDALKHLAPSWSGEVAGMVGLTLGNDNRRILDSRFILLGVLCTDKRVNAAKFWDNMDAPSSSQSSPESLSLSFSIPDCGIFKFPNGGLVSEYLDGDAIPHKFLRGDVQVPDGELPDSYLGFAVRAYIIPTRETYAKINLMLFPLPKDMLNSNHPLCENPCFPGISLFSGEFPLLPRSADNPLKKNWGCPLTPAVIPGASTEESNNVPRTPLLRAAVALLLRKTHKPESKSGHQNLMARWTEIFEQGESKLKEHPLEQIWPLLASRSVDFTEGRIVFRSFLL